MSTPLRFAAREQARTEKLEALHTTLTEQIAALRSGADWQGWLKVAARFHNYSMNNILLIAAQRPDASAVAGFESWKTLDRQVDKGERGIAILAPVLRRIQPGNNPSDATDHATDKATAGLDTTGDSPGQPGSRRLAGFRIAHVFDVSQTSGEPLPERPVPQLLAGQAPTGLWDALAGQVTERGFGIERGPCVPATANGVTNYLSRTVTVRADIDDAQAVKTLAHELAHVLLHDPTSDDGGAAVVSSAVHCRGRIEVEAESVAYLVTHTHGLDSAAYTFPYVAGWAGSVDAVTPETVVRATGQRVLGAARLVLAGTDHLQADSGVAADLAIDVASRVRGITVEPNVPPRAAQPPGDRVHATAHAEHNATQPAVARRAPTAAGAITPLEDGPAGGIPPAQQLAMAGSEGGPYPDRLVHVHQLAVAFYARQLNVESSAAHRAAALLSERRVDAAAVLDSGLGYAPRGWTHLTDHLRTAGVSDEELVASGLSLVSGQGTLIDRFRDRLIFPVHDPAGRPVALLGRAVDATATDRHGNPVPKYLNSPDTAIYRKGEVLYGLAEGRRALLSGAVPVLVEGPMDVLAVSRTSAAATSGSPPGAIFVGVAPCGTALTTHQVKLLHDAAGGRPGWGVVVAFDGDPAGRAAALRSFPLLTGTHAWPLAAEFPAGQDPAALLERHGPAALLAALAAASERPLADLVIDDRVDRYRDQLRWAEGQVAAARSAATAIVALPTAHIGRQIVRLTGRLDLPPATISDLLVDAVCGPSHHTNDNQSGEFAEGARSDQRTSGRIGAGTGPAAAASELASASAPAESGQTQAEQSAAQLARAGFPLSLAASLTAPTGPAAPARSLPAAPNPTAARSRRPA